MFKGYGRFRYTEYPAGGLVRVSPTRALLDEDLNIRQTFRSGRFDLLCWDHDCKK